MPAADREHGVDRLDAGLHGLVYALACNHVGRDAFDGPELGSVDRALAVDGLAERVHNAADQRISDGNLGDATRGSRLVALFDFGVVAQHYTADRIFFKVQRNAGNRLIRVRELN